MPKGRVVFVVEGDLEKEFLQKHCGTRAVIRKVPSNGEDVALETLVAMVVAILETIKNPGRVFIILDRETRPTTAISLESQFASKLVENGIGDTVSVHFADRMIENWIIADPDALTAESLEVDLAGNAEGCAGKSKLKQAFKQLHLSYSERIDGVRLLGKCKASTIAQNSVSFARLHSAISAESLPCVWAST